MSSPRTSPPLTVTVTPPNAFAGSVERGAADRRHASRERDVDARQRLAGRQIEGDRLAAERVVGEGEHVGARRLQPVDR